MPTVFTAITRHRCCLPTSAVRWGVPAGARTPRRGVHRQRLFNDNYSSPSRWISARPRCLGDATIEFICAGDNQAGRIGNHGVGRTITQDQDLRKTFASSHSVGLSLGVNDGLARGVSRRRNLDWASIRERGHRPPNSPNDAQRVTFLPGHLVRLRGCRKWVLGAA